ncbi:hypothetical protein [Falsigemmobacter faecalis]|uniref:Site-2 protease family protein n=1 Tax=Falsigemmobacter faecalis TaxID=2488730 RepID=A0A3P3D7I7_9RHOB|nr:hypothetical protein [Falsigemmobacter faecalis]RRH70307.1 hypothetical protein EG244_17105 [Falsigemmobacter faecalis]
MVFLHNLTMAEILSRIVAAFLFSGLAGGLTAVFMRLLGEPAARHAGRLSASPFRHVSLSGIFLAIAFRACWFLPLPVTPTKGLRRFGPVLAVPGAMAVMLALVPVLDLLRSPLHAVLPRGPGYMVLAEIDTLQIVIVNSVVLGLLPLPGLWLGTVVPTVLPHLEKRWRKSTGIGLSLAAVLLILGWFPDLRPLLNALRLV